MYPVSKVTLSKRDFDDDLYLKIAQQIQILLESGHVLVIEDIDSGKGTIEISYVPADPMLGEPYPYFLLPDEAEIAARYHDKRMLETYKMEIDRLNKVEEPLDQLPGKKKYDA